MSVPKSRRGESPAEYINLARDIYVFTYNRVRILPKSYIKDVLRMKQYVRYMDDGCIIDRSKKRLENCLHPFF